MTIRSGTDKTTGQFAIARLDKTQVRPFLPAQEWPLSLDAVAIIAACENGVADQPTLFYYTTRG